VGKAVTLPKAHQKALRVGQGGVNTGRRRKREGVNFQDPKTRRDVTSPKINAKIRENKREELFATIKSGPEKR